ncbi:MAG: hypothetical protein WCP09_03225 [Candidatus Taylorbacteria bacterium]
MPHLMKCKLCGTALFDKSICSDCLILKYENVLGRIQDQLRRNYKQALPVCLATEILNGSYKTTNENMQDKRDKQRAEVRRRNQEFLHDIMTSAASLAQTIESDKPKS